MQKDGYEGSFEPLVLGQLKLTLDLREKTFFEANYGVQILSMEFTCISQPSRI